MSDACTRLPIWQVDAFASGPFTGNPAAVVLLDAWPPDAVLAAIAAENNLAETAFLVPGPRPGTGDPSSHHDLRWFTPTVEVDLCGHATLAAAVVLFEERGFDEPVVRFDSNSGVLSVRRDAGTGRYVLDLPSNPPVEVDAPAGLLEALGLGVAEVEVVLRGRTDDLVVVLADEAAVVAVDPDMRALAAVPARGIVVTAPGDDVDLVSRFFAPGSGIDEDPVTGSAHTLLAPWWAARLGHTTLRARQRSARGGDLWLDLLGDRVEVAGTAVLYLQGEILV